VNLGLSRLQNRLAELEKEGSLSKYPYWSILGTMDISDDKKLYLESVIWLLSE
jgi:hypothetical protein